MALNAQNLTGTWQDTLNPGPQTPRIAINVLPIPTHRRIFTPPFNSHVA